MGHQTPPPSYSPQASTHKHAALFPPPRWNDIWAAILFVLHFLGVVAAVGYTVHRGVRYELMYNVDLSTFTFPIINFGTVVLVAILVSLIVLRAMRVAPAFMIHFSMLTTIVLFALMAVVSAILQLPHAVIALSILAVLEIFWYLLSIKRIPFSAALLTNVISVLDLYPAMYLAAGLSTIVAVVYFGLVFTAVAATFYLINHGSVGDNAIFVFVYLAFSGFWTTEVILNTLQTCVAGVYATFYFLHGTGQLIVNPTAASMRRATTYSFGSICFGSLLVALIRTLRFVLKSFKDDRNLTGAIVGCLLAILEDLMSYFNFYAYTYIAIYGTSYISAAKCSWNLMKSHGVDAIVNDNLIGSCLFLFSLFVAVLTSAISSGICHILGRNEDIPTYALGSAVLGLAVSLIISQIIAAGSTATFVCLAEDPEALRRTKPELYNYVMQKYNLHV